MGSMLPWLTWLTGLPVILTGLFMVYRGLWGDRRQARTRRCPKCWYAMTGVPGLRCPECGQTWDSEQVLHRVRRRRVMAIAGVLIFAIGYAGATYPKWRNGWRELMPTTALLWTKSPPVVAESPHIRYWTNAPPAGMSRWAEELWNRYVRGDLAGWQQRWLIARDLDETIITRANWLEGEPLCVYFAPRWLYKAGRDRTLQIRLAHAREKAMTCQITPLPAAPVPAQRLLVCRGVIGPFTLETIPADGNIELEIELREFDDASKTTSHVVLSRVIQRSIKLTAKPEEILQLVTDEETTGLVRDSLNLQLMGANGRYQCMASIVPIAARQAAVAPPGQTAQPSRVPVPELQDLALGVEIDLVHNGEVVASATSEIKGDAARVLQADLNDPAWTIRVKSRVGTSIRDVSATRAWSGEFVLPKGQVSNTTKK